MEYIASEGLDGPEPSIFMGLQDGNLLLLIKDGGPFSLGDIGKAVLHHMLQALDYLAGKNIIHRDVKPENIIYKLGEDQQYHFRLSDFGLSNFTINATSWSGTLTYMAPEVSQPGQLQTHKLDVWSLYVTILWTYDISGFRQLSENTPITVQTILSLASEDTIVSPYSLMAREIPEHRASVAQMLVKCFDGKGLSTPLAHVLPITELPSTTSDEVIPVIHGPGCLSNQFEANALTYNNLAAAPTCDRNLATGQLVDANQFRFNVLRPIRKA